MGQSWKTIVLVLAVVLMSVLMENVEERNRKTFQNSSRNLKKKDINNEPKIVSKSFQKWSLGGPRGLPGGSPGPLGGRSGVVRAPFAGCIGNCNCFRDENFSVFSPEADFRPPRGSPGGWKIYKNRRKIDFRRKKIDFSEMKK